MPPLSWAVECVGSVVSKTGECVGLGDSARSVVSKTGIATGRSSPRLDTWRIPRSHSGDLLADRKVYVLVSEIVRFPSEKNGMERPSNGRYGLDIILSTDMVEGSYG